MFIHFTGSVVNLSGRSVLLDSPWDHLNQPTMPCQGKAGARGLHHPCCYIVQAFPGMVLNHSNEPWAQEELAQASTLARDHPQSAVWVQVLCIRGERVWSCGCGQHLSVGFVTRMDPGSAEFTNKDVAICHEPGFRTWWSTSASIWHFSTFCPIQWTRYFSVHLVLFAEVILQTASLLSC